MKYTVFNLIKTANQSFNANIGDNNFEFRFRTFRGLLYCSVLINGEQACGSVRCTPNRSLFPSVVNDTAGGIFAFLCVNDDYPAFDQFDGVTSRFAFCTYEELKK